MVTKRKLGAAFTDEVLKVTHPFGHFQGKKIKDIVWEDNFLPHYQESHGEKEVSKWRLVTLFSICLIIFFGLFLRLFHLQVAYGVDNRERADLNRIKLKIIHAPRGVIYDRNGKVLAESNPGFRLKDQFITRDQALMLEAKQSVDFDSLEIDTIRHYSQGEFMAHVLGYVGQISKEQLKDSKYRQYRIGDRIGQSGIEQIYESVLRGKDGAEIIEIDASGKKLRTLRQIDPVPGKNVHLSLDADLQQAVFKVLEKGIIGAKSCCGAAVIENPKTGEVLALVSYPSFDGNVFTEPDKNEELEKYFTDPSSPMLNRAIGGTYPPGSTFKITSALAALSSNKIKADTEIEDTGEMSLGPYKFANWYFTSYGKKEGWIDVVKALQRSNDIFFYQIGNMVGEKVLGETAKKLGMGKKLGIDLPGEVEGLIPTSDWKKKNVGEVWYPGDNLHMAIGQGFVLTTPLQILTQTAYVASDGKLIQPHLATRITYTNKVVANEFNYQPLAKNIFKKEDLELVKKGLELVPKDGGTAWPFFNFSIPTAGKTGTAEFGDTKGRTHAWYTSYAPLDNPEIALTILIEAGGEGSSIAAPVAKDIYTWYFNPDKNNIKSLDLRAIATSSAKTLGE